MIAMLLAIPAVTTFNLTTTEVHAYSAGWQKNNTGWWYATSNRSWHANRWAKINNKWYHFKPNGYMTTGWMKSGNDWYYLRGGNDGSMATGWINLSGKWYHLKSGNDGRMTRGWLLDGGKWYYLRGGDDGSMVANQWIKSGGKEYYLESSGAMATNKWIGQWYVDGSGAWVANANSANAGKIQKQRILSPAVPAVYETQRVLISPAVPVQPAKEAVYETKEVLVTPAVAGKDAVYENQIRNICHTCNEDITGFAKQHVFDNAHAGYGNQVIPVEISPAVPAQEAVYEDREVLVSPAIPAQPAKEAVYEIKEVLVVPAKEAVYEYYWE